MGRTRLWKTRALALVVALLLSVMAVPVAVQPAHAVINFGDVRVSMQGSVAMTTGSTVSVACSVSPASHAQMPNCFTSYCPSGCDFGNTETGCLNAEGQCTCFGGGYTTYYPSVSVSSSNPGVARATYSGGALQITAYAPGTTTLSVNADLRLWTSGYASMTVTVSDPPQADAGSGSGAGAGSGSAAGTGSAGGSASGSAGGSASGSGSGGSSSGGSGSGSGSGSAVQGSVSVSSSGVSTSSAVSRVMTAVVTDDETVVEQGAEEEAPAEIELAQIGEVDAAELLAAIAGTNASACFWQGESADEADFLWMFSGEQLDPETVGDAAADLDLTVEDVTKTQTRLLEALSGKTYVALGFAHEGALPSVATLGCEVSRTFKNGERLALYHFDEKADALVLVEKGIEVVEGYASFSIDHCSIWVLSDDDQLEGSLAGEQEAASSEPQDAVGEPEVQADGSSWVVVVAGAVVVLAVAVVAAWALRRRKATSVGVAAGAVGAEAGAAASAADAGASVAASAVDAGAAGDSAKSAQDCSNERETNGGNN